MTYTVFEVDGKQYLAKPGEILEVDRLTTDKELVVDKVLLNVDGAKVELGTPYLKKNLTFEVIQTVKKPKIRVATYHAKANYRRVKGQRPQVTQIKMKPGKAVKKA